MSPVPAFSRSVDHEYKSAAPDQTAIVKILVLVSVFGWILFGIMSILCINGRGRAGRWVPEWYLDSRGSFWDRAAVGAWWVAVIVLWPVILPVLAVRMGFRGLARHVRGRERKETATTQPVSTVQRIERVERK